MDPDWESIARDLAYALESFMAFDGYGQGGSEDGNQGNWEEANAAIMRYREAAS